MAERIYCTDKPAERIRTVGKPLRRIEPAEFAAALGAEPCGQSVPKNADPITLAELGNELIKRLRSTGGRPALVDANHRCKVPLSPADIAALEQIIDAIEQQTGTRPSLGQIASVILRVHLESRKDLTAAETKSNR